MYRGKYSKSAVRQRSHSKPRIGTIVFYGIYGFFVTAFIVAVLVAMNLLQDWLVRYEASQPENKAEQVFQDLFSSPDWAELYSLADISDTPYEGKDSFANYMTQKVGSTALTYEETAAGLSGDRKYIVSLSDEKLATFTLTGGSDTQTEIVSWELGSVELFFQRTESVLVEKFPEHTIYINGVPLTDSHTIRKTYTGAEEMLPEGIHSYRMEQQYVDGLLLAPEITVKDAKGNPVTMVKNPDTGILTPVLPESAPMTEAERERILDAAKAYSLFLTRKITKGEFANYFDKTTTLYKDLVTAEAYVQPFDRHEFLTDENSVLEFCRYSDDLFSARVVMTMRQFRSGWKTKDFHMNTTFFFTKNEDGIFLVTDLTNVAIQDIKEEVRLTFYSGDSVLTSQMVDSKAATLELPAITAPQGQYLKGWAIRENDGHGKVTMTIVLTAGENGIAQLDPQNPLEPMTLYPIFEKEAN